MGGGKCEKWKERRMCMEIDNKRGGNTVKRRNTVRESVEVKRAITNYTHYTLHTAH